MKNERKQALKTKPIAHSLKAGKKKAAHLRQNTEPDMPRKKNSLASKQTKSAAAKKTPLRKPLKYSKKTGANPDSDRVDIRNERYWRSLVESAAFWIWQTNDDLKHIYCNTFVKECLGYEPDEFLQLDAMDLVHPDDHALFNEVVKNARNEKKDWTDTVLRWKHKDGSWRHIESRGWAVFDAKENFKGLQGIGRDVTDRIFAIERLRENMRNFERAEKIANIGNWEWDIVNDQIAWSDGVYKIYGADPQKDKPSYDLVLQTLTPEDRERFSKSVQDAISCNAEFDGEYRIIALDGKERFTHTAGEVVRDNSGQAVLMFGIVQDITEQKKAMYGRMHLHELLRYIIEHTRSAVAVHDRNLKYIYVSQRYLDEYNVKERDVIGKHHYDVFPDLPQKWRDVHQRALKGEVLSAEDDPYEREDGSVEWTRWECRPWYQGDGSIGGIIVYTEVITKRKQAEEALRRRERQLAESQRIAKIGSWEHNLQTGEVFWSDELFRLLGLNPEKDSLDFKMFFQMVHPDDQPNLRDSINMTLEEKTPFKVDYRIIPRDGTTRSIHAQAELIPDDKGKFVVLAGTAQDITERKEIERRLQENEMRLQTVLDNVGAYIFLKDTQYRYVFANQMVGNLFGVRSDDIIGKKDEDFFSSDSVAEIMKSDRPVIEQGKTIMREEIGLLGPDKEPRTYWTIKLPLRDNRGTVVGLCGISTDISDRKMAEEKIIQGERFIRNILDTVDEGFLVINRDYRIVTANKAYCGQSGRPYDDIIGKHCYEISHNSDRPCYEKGEECAVLHVFETGHPHTAVHTHHGADGMNIYVETKAFPIRDETGNVTSVIETINNITEKHLLEEERLKTQKLESIGTLAGGIAHDFNNLLQGIFGYISMTKMTLNNREKALAMLEQSEKALHLAVNLTSQLLTFSKGGKPLKKLIRLRPVVENAVRFALSGSHTSYAIDCEDDLWALEADEGQLAQVIQNIVLNADEAMAGKGNVDISLKNTDLRAGLIPGLPEGGQFVMIVIRDHGIGIPDDHLSRIFDPYFTTKHKGSGLGLATSFSIVRNHGGVFDVNSKLNNGSTFTVYLPALKDALMNHQSPAPATVGTRKGRILVMDDEVIVRTVARELITALGHEVETAQHGEEALKMFQQAREEGRSFDIVLLDLTVRGGMGGEETIRHLREIDPEVIAVVSSGYADSPIVANYSAYGFSAILNKPYRVTSLKDCLTKLLQTP